MASTLDKQQLREQALRIRKTLSIGDLSKRICGNLIQTPVFKEAEVVLSYWPLPEEVDVSLLIQQYPQKQWYLPRIDITHDELIFHRYQPGDPLESHRFGMLEPLSTAPDLPPNCSSAFMILPALAYDQRGYRLGYGKSYYDRFLANRSFSKTLLRVGVSPEALVLAENIPDDPWDVPVHQLFTENWSLSFSHP
jgi:5-formyltetrahydrofolate cyclo-ligase